MVSGFIITEHFLKIIVISDLVYFAVHFGDEQFYFLFITLTPTLDVIKLNLKITI